jgi:hypothetical protein
MKSVPCLPWGRTRIREKRNLVPHKRFILLLGLFLLSSHAPAVAQSPVAQIVLAQKRVAPGRAMLRMESTPLPAASFLLSQNPGRSSAQFSFQFTEAYQPDRSLQLLPPTEEVNTVFFTQMSLPLFRLGRGRVQLDAFQSTIHMQDAQFGPVGFHGSQGFLSSRQAYPADPSSVGLSLSFHFGRGARSERPVQAVRRITRFLGAVLE